MTDTGFARSGLLAGAMCLGGATALVGCGDRCQPGETVSDGNGNCVAVTQSRVAISCGTATRLVGRRCVSTRQSVSCGAGTVLIDNVCQPAVTCGENTEESDNACVPVGTVCGTGTIFDVDSGTCVDNAAAGCGDETSENMTTSTCELSTTTLCGEGTVVADDGRCIVPARLQIVHNAAGVAGVDVYLVPAGSDVATGTAPFAELEFRAATAFVTLPSNESFDVYVALNGEAEPQRNAAITSSFRLSPGSATRLVATDGGIDRPPSMLQLTGVDAASASDVVAVQVFHGSSDAPAVDVFFGPISTRVSGEFALAASSEIADDLNYTDVPGVIEVAPADYVVTAALDGDDDDIFTPEDLVEVSALLEDAGGASVFLMASGLLADAAFALVAVGSDGTSGPLTGAAEFQAIHNAADPELSTVDVSISGALLEDVDFRTATATFVVPSRVDVEVRATGGDTDLAAGRYADLGLPAASRTVAIVNGVFDTSDFSTNPDGESVALALFSGGVPAASAEARNVDLVVFHGSTDTDNVDLSLSGGPTLVDGLVYGAYSSPIPVIPGDQSDLQLDVVVNTTPTATVAFDSIPSLVPLAGKTVVVCASGFSTPGNNRDGESFDLFAFPPEGGEGIDLSP